MSDDYLQETQFSIYRIAPGRVEEVLPLKKRTDDLGYMDEIISAILKSTTSIVNKKKSAEVQKIKYKNFQGLIFKTVHDPAWKGVAKQLWSYNEVHNSIKEYPSSFITNSNVSYILLYLSGDYLYAMTGGYGSNYISKFIDKNFGLNLLPKVIKRDNPVLRQVIENNLTGNQASVQRANRQKTNFIVEQEMSSIFRQLNIEVDREVASLFGIKFNEDESTSKRLNIVNKDSLVIRRSLSLTELEVVLKKLNLLSKKKDNFVLNYLVLATKKNIRNAELLEILKRQVVENNLRDFVLVGDEYAGYCLNATCYCVYDDNDDIFLESKSPIMLKDVFDELQKRDIRLTLAFAYMFLKKWTISAWDDAGRVVLAKTPFFEAMQGHVDYGPGRDPCYLFNGDWYVFDTTYIKALTKEFSDLFDEKSAQADALITKYKLQKPVDTEEKYNELLISDPNILVAHKVEMSYVEIADAIFWTDTTLYLMHNKGKFNGNGARDLTNQILTAAEYVEKIRSAIKRDEQIGKYYDSILSYRPTQDISYFPRDEFISSFINKKIVYIQGYLDNYRQTSRSQYAKYLTVELNRRLKRKSFESIPISLT